MQNNAKDTEVLRAYITILFRLNCSDDEIIQKLKFYSYTISITQVLCLQKELGLMKRVRNVFKRNVRDRQLYEILRAKLDEG